jgi:hypothetical protein
MLEVMVLSYCHDHGIACAPDKKSGRRIAAPSRK